MTPDQAPSNPQGDEPARPVGIDRDQLAALPTEPGCYLFLGPLREMLYVGKAKNLRARVRSYFQEQSQDLRAFIPWLRKRAVTLETIVTANEKEAAILENTLIKEHRPRYNVKLRDDKEYLSLRLDPTLEFPRLELVRRPASDQARYFGPYPSATAARRTLHLAERHFQLRTCSDRELSSRKRPCVQYQIKRCPGPCVLPVDAQAYAAQVRAVGLFLEGRHDQLGELLQERMQKASLDLDFEQAAILRDQLQAIRGVQESQRVVSAEDRDLDVLGLYRQEDQVELVLLLVRSGRVTDVLHFGNLHTELDDRELVAAFVRDQYGAGVAARTLPEEILVPALPDAAEGIEEWLSGQREADQKKRVRLIQPQRGSKKKLLELAVENAHHAFEQQQKAKSDATERLTRLQQRLRLPRLPQRIECVDISHLGGEDTVGAVVRVTDASPDKAHYRSYRVRTVSGGDDYGALREVLSRRFQRGKDAPPGSTLWELPDLFVVDGGRGQLAVAQAAAADLGLVDLPLVALAKEKDTPKDKLTDRVYLPGQKNPIPLRPGSDELLILALARDEAHRFANRGRDKVGRWRLRSRLREVEGIGDKTQRALLLAFPSLAAIAEASDEALLAVPGVNRRNLQALREAFPAEPT